MIFYKFLFFISDFLEIQRKSFYLFLNIKLGEEFSKIQPLVNSQYLRKYPSRWDAIYFLYEFLKFLKPKLSIEESIILSKTYCCHFYLPVEFIEHSKVLTTNYRKVQWIFLGTLPLLTRRGHFIVNGTPRIVLNQIVRSPGVYFHKKNSRLFYAEIISNSGPWVRIEIDNKKKIWIYLQQSSRISLSDFFENFNKKFFDHHFYIREKKNSNAFFLEKNIKAKKKISSILFASSIRSSDLNFDLEKNGRIRLNKKLGLSLKTQTLTPIDFLAISDILYKLVENSNFTVMDDIDDLKNRKFKTIGELLQNQLARGLQRLQKTFNKNISRKDIKNGKAIPSALKNKFSILNSQPINTTFKEFFHSNQLSQYLDQSNPLAEITHKRRLSCLGSGGVNRDTAGMDIRGIHVTHYGRICPIETPEGRNAGLVNSLTTAANVNNKGFLETPFIEVYKQHLQSQKKLIFFSGDLQESKNVFFSQKLPKFKNLSVSIIQLQTQKFKKCALNLINNVIYNPQQFLSIATTCIPFVEHDDANRALMGSNMQRQALPLINLEQPFVTTLNAFRVLSDLKDIPVIFESGFILYVSQQKISFYNSPYKKYKRTLCEKIIKFTTSLNFLQLLLNFD
uniref:DNA-directed RNA polymerase n=1 Tax=Flabellia petiolata TaxID=189428 RepID=A0A386AX64_9CHLO|nr:RNA polymerase b-subunit [Flabellia petiolata]